LKKSPLARAESRTIYFNIANCRIWGEWLKGNIPSLLAQAHYYWAIKLASPAMLAETLARSRSLWTAGDRAILHEVGQHIVQLATTPELMREIMIRGLRLPNPPAIAVADRAIAAAISWRFEGDAREAVDLLAVALAALTAARSDRNVVVWVEAVAVETWTMFCLSGVQTARELLDKIDAEWPTVASSSAFQAYARFEHFRRNDHTPETEQSAPALVENLARSLELLCSIRRTRGFTDECSGIVDYSGNAPIPTMLDFHEEMRLRDLHVSILLARTEDADEVVESLLLSAMEEWHDRLVSVQPDPGLLGGQAVHSLCAARYTHSLLQCLWRASPRVTTVDETETAVHASFEKRRNWTLLRFFPQDASSAMEAPDSLFDAASREYERALRIALLLKWMPIVAETSFRFGTLLQTFTPNHIRAGEPPWWERWDAMFQNCVDLESTLEWVFWTPSVHRLRWEFFQLLNQPTSIADADLTYRAVVRARFPRRVIIDWQVRVRNLRTSYSRTSEDCERCCELWLEWGDSLAQFDEAMAYRRFSHCIEYERAHAMDFAAQAKRLAEDFDGALALLDRADREIASADPAGATLEPRAEVRRLVNGLKLQRAWLASARGAHDQYVSLIRELWTELEFEDEIASNVIGSMVDIERSQHTLGQAWPETGVSSAGMDTDNASFSLPDHWMTTGEAMPTNRFEFRFLQFLHLVLDWPVASDYQLLVTATILRWRGRNRYAEIVLQFADLDRRYNFGQHVRPLILRTVRAVSIYFGEVERDNRHQLHALRILMHRAPEDTELRDEYIKVLRENEELIIRQLRQANHGMSGSFRLATLVKEYLEILIASELVAEKLAYQLRTMGQSVDQFLASKRVRDEELRLALVAFESRNHGQCLTHLGAAIGPENRPWVFWEDLQALDLWIRVGALTNLDVSSIAWRLRQEALTYVRQFSLVIPEQGIQHLAVRLLDELEREPAVAAGS
jgi:hypothetical protein